MEVFTIEPMARWRATVKRGTLEDAESSSRLAVRAIGPGSRRTLGGTGATLVSYTFTSDPGEKKCPASPTS